VSTKWFTFCDWPFPVGWMIFKSMWTLGGNLERTSPRLKNDLASKL
jgi:hypothetical protein